MRLNKRLNGLMIALPLIAITACSANKNTSNDQTNKDIIGVDTSINANSSNNISSKEEVPLQLQKNNIIYFELDKYNIRSDFTAILDNHASFLRSNPSYKVTIEGHADERGTPEYNIALGERRANAVKMYLQGNGVSADQITIVSYGKEKPMVLGHDESAYAKNRRSVLLIY